MQPGPPPGSDVFTAADLEPSDDERKAVRRAWMHRAAATVAITAAGLWIGGLIALGACAAPFVFKLTPYPLSGYAMGSAFARFDGIAIGCSVVMLGCEVMRTLLGVPARKAWIARVRRYAALLMACGAIYTGMVLSPGIMALHEGGVRRDASAQGQQLEAIHGKAELIGKLLVPLGVLLIALHVFTLRSAEEELEAIEARAPLAPGPGAFGSTGGASSKSDPDDDEELGG
jgi:hypothetical protein